MWEMRAELASPMVLAAHGHLHARRRERAQLRVMSAGLKVLVRELHREGERNGERDGLYAVSNVCADDGGETHTFDGRWRVYSAVCGNPEVSLGE